MDSYLVETYFSGLGAADCHAVARRARRAADAMSRDGATVRYIRSLFVAEDETCFHVFEAPSADHVLEVSRKAGLRHSRIVPVSVEEPAARGPAS